MRIKTYGIEYVVSFRRGTDTQVTEIIEATGDKEVKNLFYDTFKGRTHNENEKAPFVKVIIQCVDRVKKETKVVMKNRIYNLSPRNARIEFQKAIKLLNN